MISFPKFIIRQPVLMSRSYLYCIEPIGIGTPLVESLTGYLSRVAEAHQLSVSLLFGHELAPHADKEYLRRAALRLKYPCRIFASAFRSLARAMNGLGTGASEWIRILQKLTLRSDLTYLSMLPLKGILPHAQLLRRARAWCSACYRDWDIEGKIIYEPLLWSLRATTICPYHHQPLSITCQHCEKQLHPLASRSKPGYCSNCKRWLGNDENLTLHVTQDADPSKTKMHLWVSQAISELLAATPNIASLPLQGGVIKSMSTLIRECEGGLQALSRLFQVNKTTIWQWMKGKRLPRFDLLLKVCFRINTPVLQFLRGEATSIHFKLKAELPSDENSKSVCFKRKRRPLSELKTRQTLLAALNEAPPPPLDEIARRLGRDSNTLRYQFSELCKAIVERYASYRSDSVRARSMRIIKVLQSLLDRDIVPPSLPVIAKQINCDVNTLRNHAPHLCQAIANRQAEARKNRLEKIHMILIAALSEYPPPSILKLAERLGCSKSSLYTHFSDTCHLLAQRRLLYHKTR